MQFSINEKPDESDINEIRSQLQEHNAPHWEVDNKYKYVISLRDNKKLIGGLVFTIFGEWLEIDFFWIDSEHRTKGYGQELLNRAEDFAKSNSCKMSFLNTFSFQAKPFYEKNGYKVVYTQENYPVVNSRYFMEKTL